MHRLAVYLAFLAAAFPVLAGDVVLEARKLDVKTPHVGQLKEIRFEKAEKPADAVAPEGRFSWGKLVVGTTSHWLCVSSSGKAFVVFDSDGDADLAEEKPVAGSVTVFGQEACVLEDVPGSIRIGETAFNFKLTVLAMPRILLGPGIVPVCTVFSGRTGFGDGTVEVCWIPGETPSFKASSPALSGAAVTEVYSAGMKLQVTGELKLTGGKIIAAVESNEEKGLIELDAPAGADCFAFGGGSRIILALPSKGKFTIPAGNYEQGVLACSRKGRDGVDQDLVTIIEEPKIAPGFTLGALLPLRAAVVKKESEGNLVFEPSTKDNAGRDFMILRQGERLKTPALSITGPDGKEVLRHDFEYG